MGRNKKETFLYNVDKDKVQELLEDTDNNSVYFNSTCDDIVNKYTANLDSLMSDIYKECVIVDYVDDVTLEKYYLELTNHLYFLQDKIEKLSVKADMAKAAAQEVYNKSYLDNQVIAPVDKKDKITVAELQARAQNDSQYQEVVASVFDHASKLVRSKVDAAYEMVSSLKRIVVKREKELQLSTSANYFTNKNKEEEDE